MKTSRLIVSEKIQKELMVMSPNLAREIQDIKTGTNNTEVVFRNSSSVVVTACTDNARGLRSTILIVDFKLVYFKLGEFGSELVTVYE